MATTSFLLIREQLVEEMKEKNLDVRIKHTKGSDIIEFNVSVNELHLPNECSYDLKAMCIYYKGKAIFYIKE